MKNFRHKSCVCFQSLWLASMLLASALLAGCARAETTTPGNTTGSTPANTAAPADFLIHQNDIWVQAGDSITWQALYTTYLEAFIRARYPKLAFVTVNSGKSGEVTVQGLIRFNRTMASFKPTLITSAYGMNDHVKTFSAEPNFQDDPKSAAQRFVEATQKIKARYAIISASPLLAPAKYGLAGEAQAADGTIAFSANRSNPINKLFADKMKLVAARNDVPYLDQMTPLQIVWGKNYERDFVAAMASSVRKYLDEPIVVSDKPVINSMYATIKPIVTNAELLAKLPIPDKENFVARWNEKRRSGDTEAANTYREYLKNWLATVDASTPPFVRLSGYTNSSRTSDNIHPNEAGHLQMAAAVFKLMNGDGLVSSVRIDINSRAKRYDEKAVVNEVGFQNGVLSFKRLDQSLPLPIDVLARPALGVDVSTSLDNSKDLFGMSRYLLTVNNLPQGRYEIVIDGEVVSQTTAAELSRGVDLGLMDKGPIWAQTQKLLDAVKANIIMAIPEKGQPKVSTDVAPKVLAEAQPVEHTWTVRPLK